MVRGTVESKPNRCSRALFFVSTVTSALACAVLAQALDVPPMTGRVMDLAHALPASTVESVSAQLAAHEATTSNQVAVLIVPSLEGDVLEEFSHRAATTWKLGQKGTDNGVLLLVALQERKVRIEVGYGLEGTLTDARSARIIRNDIVPRFRAGNVPGGVAAGIDAIVRTIEGTYRASERPVPPQDTDLLGQIMTAIMVGLLLGFILMNVNRLLGPIAGTGLSLLLAPWWVPALIAGGITLLLLLLLSSAGISRPRSLRSGMDDWMWYSSRGGGWGGGTFGGVGGGFSGGGGSFGGGGASGSW